MIPVIILFGVLSFIGSLALTGKQETMDRSAQALAIVLIAWGSLVLGIFVSSAQGSLMP